MATEPHDARRPLPAARYSATAPSGDPTPATQQQQVLLEMTTGGAPPQAGRGAMEDRPPRYNQVMGVEPPQYSDVVSTPPPNIHLHTQGPIHLHAADPVHLHSADTRTPFDKVFGSIFKALGQCNIVLLTVMVLAVFIIVTLAIETPARTSQPPYHATPSPPSTTTSSGGHPTPLLPLPDASSFVFIRDNKTHMVRAEMSSCGLKSSPIKIELFNWSPTAVHFGESAALFLLASVSEDIKAPIEVDVNVKKRMAFIWFPVPCVDGIGSCKYEDVCRFFPPLPAEETCPHVLPHANLPCRCPVPKGQYYIKHDIVQLPDVTILPSWLKKGRYSARITAYISATKRVLGCHKIDITVD